jgi:hypothetical protein
MTNRGAKMSNDEILMTNQFPNGQMTKASPGMGVVIRAWTFVIFFPLISPLFWGKLMDAFGVRLEVKLCV